MENREFAEKMKMRTKAFALRVIRFYQSLPKSGEHQVLGKQLLRSGTSVAANYRASCRAKSIADFIHKLSIVIEEADESAFWIELFIESNLIAEAKLKPLLQEADELTAVLVKAKKNAKKNKK